MKKHAPLRVRELERRDVPAVLADNLIQPTSSFEAAMANHWVASSFGTSAADEDLATVTLKLSNPVAGTPVVSIYTNNGTTPGTLVGSLTAPASFSSTLSNTTFTSTGLDLDPNTKYWVVLQPTSGEFDWATTMSLTGTGSGFQPGFATSDNAGGLWTTSSSMLAQMQVVTSATNAGSIAFDVAAASINESAGTATITLRRSGGSQGSASVTLSASGTASSSADFGSVPATVSFGNGETTATVTIPILNDTTAENSESLILTLSDPSGTASLGGLTSTTLTILDNDATGSFAFASPARFAAESDGTVNVTVNRTDGSTGAASITLTASGTATSGTDFTPLSTTVNFADGQTTATIPITLLGDASAESDETIVLTLSNPTNGTVLGAQANTTVTLLDDDTAGAGVVSFGIPSDTVGEAAGTANITLIRTGGTSAATTVTLTPSGSATSGGDFTGLPATVTFAAGQAIATVPLTLSNDISVEGAEALTLTLSNPTNGATLGSQISTTLNITDDDVAGAGVIAFNVASATINETAGTATVTLNRTGGNTLATTVTVGVSGTATSGVDFTTLPTSVSFAAGQTTATITVPITNDVTAESTETLILTLSNPTNGATLGSTATTTLNITDDDTPNAAGAIGFSVSAASVNEGTGIATVTLTRTGGSTGSVSVTLTATGGTAGAGDFSGLPALVTFAAGQTTATVNLPIVNDTAAEGSETIFLAISGPTGGATLGTPAASTLTILDNDTGTNILNFANAVQSVGEAAGAATITLTRTGDISGTASATVTVSGTAASGTDFTALPSTVTFAAGQATATIPLTITNDATAEGTETIVLTLLNPTNGATLGTQASTTITISDDESTGAGTITFLNTTPLVREGDGAATVTLLRSGGTTGSVTVTVSATGGIAINNNDYSGLPATVTFADGQSSATLSIPITDDKAVEGLEQLTLGLSNATGGAAIGTAASANLTIIDNERTVFTAVGAGSGEPTVFVFTNNGTLQRTIQAFDASFVGGVRVATGDITGDGVDDILVGAGPGGGPHVKVFNGATGAEIVSFFAFETFFTGGVFVAAGDVTGDGRADLIVSPDEGGGPVVAVYDGSKLAAGLNAGAQITRFFGIEDPAFRGGARVSTGDFNADGFDDILVSAGFRGGPRIALFTGADLAANDLTPGHLIGDFFAFESGLRNGAYVAAGDVNNDGFADMIFGAGPGGGPRVRIFDGRVVLNSGNFSNLNELVNTARIADFFAGNTSKRGGIRVTVGDRDGDGQEDDLFVGSGEGERSATRVYLSNTIAGNISPSFDFESDPFSRELERGVFVG